MFGIPISNSQDYDKLEKKREQAPAQVLTPIVGRIESGFVATTSSCIHLRSIILHFPRSPIHPRDAPSASSILSSDFRLRHLTRLTQPLKLANPFLINSHPNKPPALLLRTLGLFPHDLGLIHRGRIGRVDAASNRRLDLEDRHGSLGGGEKIPGREEAAKLLLELEAEEVARRLSVVLGESDGAFGLGGVKLDPYELVGVVPACGE